MAVDAIHLQGAHRQSSFRSNEPLFASRRSGLLLTDDAFDGPCQAPQRAAADHDLHIAHSVAEVPQILCLQARSGGEAVGGEQYDPLNSMRAATPWHPWALMLCCILTAAAPGAALAQGGQPTALASALNSLSGAAVPGVYTAMAAAAPLSTTVDTLVSSSRPRTTSQRGALPAPAPAPAQFAALKDGTVLMRGVGLGGYAHSSVR